MNIQVLLHWFLKVMQTEEAIPPKVVLIIVIENENVFLVEICHPEDLKVEEDVWLITVIHWILTLYLD